ncbi:HGxxPAAW family protein [Streptomyces sp. NPDC059917]|uniref:HGxxPAAW family protein n=1 Tax=Streptomyces sp. NPDC059917 TaxID=3347002 RepID=UPI003654A209
MSAHGDVDLGHTVAGWTGTAVGVFGSTVTGLAVCLGSTPGVWAGLALVLLSLLATWVLHLAGWGKPSGPRPHAQRDWRVRDTAARAGHADCVGCRVAARGTHGGGARAHLPVDAPAAG